MFKKFTLIFSLAFCLSLFSAHAVFSQDEAELKRIEKETELTKARNKLLEEQIREEEQKQRLKNLQRGNGSVNNSGAATTGNTTIGDTTNPTTGGNTTGTTSGGTTGATSGTTDTTTSATNQPNDDCAVNELDSAGAKRATKAACIIINRIAEAPENNISPNLVGVQISEILAGRLAPSETERNFFVLSERQRTDKQVGSSPNSSGTTSLVVKGGTPAIIGWAVENGAATSSFSGNTVTTRFNPLNLGKALFHRQGLLQISDIKRKNDAFDTFLRKLSVGLSFDTTRGNPPGTPVFTGKEQQLSAFSFRYEFINDRNPLLPKYKEKREQFFFGQTANFDKIAKSIGYLIDANNDRFANAELRKWLDETNRELANIDPNLPRRSAERRARLAAIIQDRVAKLPFDQLKDDEDFKANLKNFIDGTIGFKEKRDDFLEELSKGAVATFEYTNNREPIAPDTSNFRFIYEKGIIRDIDFTFNASLTMYNKKPTFTGVRQLRDFQFALQLDKSLKNTFGLGNSVLSFAGRYERLNSDTVDALGFVKRDSKGDIVYGQFKLTIPIGDTGIKLPFSATFSNRTELIKESDVRGNFGISFDLDPLFARFKPF